MDNFQTTILVVHTLIALGIVVLVLFQRGKGAEAGAAFGAGASGTVFGSRGSSNFFSRATAILATAFFATSLTLAYISSQTTARGPDSLIEDLPAPAAVEQAAPADVDTGDDVPSLPAASEETEAAPDSEVPALVEPEESESTEPEA